MITSTRLNDRTRLLDPEDPHAKMRARYLARREGLEQVPSETYTVLRLCLSSLKKKIDSYARRATKLGCAPVALEELGSEWVERGDGLIEIVTVKVTGDMPDTGDWRFIANLNHKEKAEDGTPLTIIRRRNGSQSWVSEEKVEEYRQRGPVCDHCDVRRARHDTYVLFNVKTEETVQVGRSCLEQFTGQNPKAALYHFDKNSELRAQLARGGELRDGVQPELAVPLAYYLHAHLQFRAEGRRIVPSWIWRRALRIFGQVRADQLELNERDYEDVSDFICRAEADLGSKIDGNELSEHEHNMAVLVKSRAVAMRHTDLANDLVEWYRRKYDAQPVQQPQEAPKATVETVSPSPNQWAQLTQGQPVSTQVRVTSIKFFPKHEPGRRSRRRAFSIVNGLTQGTAVQEHVWWFAAGDARKDGIAGKTFQVEGEFGKREFSRYHRKQISQLENVKLNEL